MRNRRKFPIFLGLIIVAAAVTLAVQLRKHAPPEPARLLPGADAFFYVDLGTIRKANKELPQVSHDPEYERFIHETGFQFERDLDEAAFAVHYPVTWAAGATGDTSGEVRFSEVLVGKFHVERLTAYLRQIAQSVEPYRSDEIFTIQLQGRSLRVAVLSPDSVAASNHDNPAVIRGIVDRSKRLASPFGGPSLLRQYYKHVQLASLVWVIARVNPSATHTLGWDAIFNTAATLVVSASYLSPLHLTPGAVHLRAEAFTLSADDARAIAEKLTVFIDLAHSAETSVGSHGTDADVKALFDSLKIRHEDDRASLTASIPFGFFHKMLAESGQLDVPLAQPTHPASPPPQ